jgi:hypothetical protein
VNAWFDGQIHKRELVPSRGFQSSVDPVLNFGLGKAFRVDSVKVIWPNRKTQVVENISGDQLITFDIKDATKKEQFIRSSKTENEKLVECISPFDPHKENSYVDFDFEGLITQMLSREGPPMDVADLNNDGRDDVFIGGATGYAGKIYLQSPEGKMILQTNDCFEKDKKYEDTAARFLDADGDGDLDLYVGSGGNDKEPESELLRDRLYINNGKGAFEQAAGAIPDFRYNTSVVAPYDFDQDGDIDLFVGSLSVSRIYGINPRHYLLENDGHGKFKDITEARAYKFRNMGMVTDAAWQDLDSDGLKDLVVAGQWMAPVIYHNSGHGLSPVATSLDTLSGWWNAVSVTDLDNDGDMDMVLGNRGNNTYLKVSRMAPVKMFVNDFDNNGSIEQIFTRYIEGRDKPIALKRELTAQLPSLQKNNVTFAGYAEKSIYELIPDDIIKNSILKEVTISESILAYNEGKNQYRIEALPKEIQFTCVNTILATDLNGDNYKDLILGENNFSFKPQLGRLDAGFAHLMMGSDTGFMKPELIGTSGQGVVKSIKEITIKNQKYIILGINDDRPKLYKVKK